MVGTGLRTRAKAIQTGSVYSLPLTVWISLFFLVPMVIVFLYSFLTRDTGGGVRWEFSLDAYAQIFKQTSEGKFIYLDILLYTLVMAVSATVLTILVALPCAYYIARTKNNTLLLFLVIIPFWVNFMIRIYAWVAILGQSGILNELLVATGLIKEPIQFLFNDYAVLLVLVYTNLPFAILPLFTTIEKFDFGLLEAARDLGASHSASLRKVMLPNIQGGIVTAVLFTFIPIFGTFAVPDVMGNASTYMLGQLITSKIKYTGDYPMASSLSVLILILTAGGLILFTALNRKQEKDRQVNIEEEAE
jgi:spermidine/putrescine transport system permease protein